MPRPDGNVRYSVPSANEAVIARAVCGTPVRIATRARTHQLVPECDGLGMGSAPGVDIVENLVVGALVLRHQAPPGTDGSTEPAGEVTRFTDLPFGLADDGVVGKAQHFACGHPVRLD